jgi:thiamine-phosphate pyrophosphorylase
MMRKYYFINKFDTNNINKQDKHTTIIYRNYSSKPIDQTLILRIKRYCKKKSIKFYLSNNIKLAIKLNLDGAYIPAFNRSLKHLAYTYKKNFRIIGSAHNLKEIRIKENQNVRKIFLSSLFKKNKNFLGINKFKLLSKLTRKKYCGPWWDFF